MNQMAPDTFIGRKEEIGIYERWLTNAKAPRILYFYDATSEPDKKGGVGKTRLLQECIKITKEKHQDKDIVIVSIDFFRITDRNSRTIAERVYNQLRNTYSGWSAHFFDKALREYQQATKMEDKDDMPPPETRNKLSEALTSDLRNLNTYLHEISPETQHTLLVVLDTFEVIQDTPSVAVFSSMQTFPDDYHFDNTRFLMAGRDPINWTQPNWQGREQEVHSVALEPFTHDETVNYMHSYKIPLEPHSPQAAILWELTSGRPILLGLVKDIVGRNTVQLEDLLSISPAEFEAQLVSQINNIDKPVNWLLLFMAHAYHRFNFSLLEWLLKKSRLQSLVGKVDRRQLEALPDLSFVRRATDESGDFTLHDEMQPLITKYCWQNLDTDKSFRQEISRCIIQYYEKELRNEHNILIRQACIVQILYHRAFIDVNQGLQYFASYFNQAINLWQNAYARTLLQEIWKFRNSLSVHQRADLVLEEARLLLKEENRQTALAYYKQLQEEAEEKWVEAHKAEIFYGLGECYLALAEFQEASRSFDNALTLERDRNNREKIADILSTLGYISRRQGEFDQAQKHYQESISIYKALGKQPIYLRELANNLNSLGYVYCLLGKIDEALIYCTTSLNIRETLFNDNELSEVAVGLSHSTLGYIYLYDGDNANAESHLKKALDAFTHTNNKKGLAIYHNRFGLLQMKSGEIDNEKLVKALKHFETAFNEAENIDEELQITSLNKQGHIYAIRKEYKDAKELFERAINLAKNVHDSYQEVESRIDLARILVMLGEYDLYHQELEQAAAIAEQQHYNKLLGEIEKLRGELSYQQRKYQDAFLHYAKLCSFMTGYNYIQYTQALRFLTGKLLELLKVDYAVEVTKAVGILRNYWTDQQLGNRFPDFIKACDDINEVNL